VAYVEVTVTLEADDVMAGVRGVMDALADAGIRMRAVQGDLSSTDPSSPYFTPPYPGPVRATMEQVPGPDSDATTLIPKVQP
jgi:hypothetical protein